MKYIQLLILVTLTIVSTSLHAAQSKLCPGESGYNYTNDRKTNPKKGGFVSDGAFVSEEVFIAPSAAVCGSATVEGFVRILGNAVVKDEAIVNGRVRVMGNAIVGGTAEVYSQGNRPTVIKGYSKIMDGVIEGGSYNVVEAPKEVAITPALQELNEFFTKALNASFNEGEWKRRYEGSFEITHTCELKIGLIRYSTQKSNYGERQKSVRTETWTGNLSNVPLLEYGSSVHKDGNDYFVRLSPIKEGYSLNYNYLYEKFINNQRVKETRDTIGSVAGDGLFIWTSKQLMSDFAGKKIFRLLQPVGDYCGFQVREFKHKNQNSLL